MDRQTQMELTDQGINRAVDKAGDGWMRYAKDFLYEVLKKNKLVTSDTLWAAGLIPSASNYALGGVWRHARKMGWVRELKHQGFTCCTVQREGVGHGRMIRVYESLVFEE